MRLRIYLSPNLYAIFYKPCFVPEVTRTTSFDNHLSTANSINLIAVRVLRSFPCTPCPDQNLGCQLEGFTAFHSLCFQRDSVTVALSSLLWPIRGLSHFNCRNDFSSLGLWFRLAQTLQASQPVLAWTFLMKRSSLHAIIQKLHNRSILRNQNYP